MAKKNIVRLTESELKRVINESVRKVLKEYDENYMDPNAYEDEYASEPYVYVIEEKYGLKGIEDSLNEWDIESVAMIIMEGIERGVFNNADESPLQIYDNLIKDIPNRAKSFYQSILDSCKLGREWVSESLDVHK